MIQGILKRMRYHVYQVAKNVIVCLKFVCTFSSMINRDKYKIPLQVLTDFCYLSLISDCRNSSDYVDAVTYYNTSLTAGTALTASSLQQHQQHQQTAQCRGSGGITVGAAAGMLFKYLCIY
jgi:hypothetical protein